MMFKLYKQLAYRLALYQVLAAMAYGAVCSMQAIFVNYDKHPVIYSRVCQVVASLTFNLEWVKLLFTTCVTFHLFCFAVFYKNLKKLEFVYITVSTLIPTVLASIPYITHTYGRAGAWCWIQDWENNCPPDIFEAGNAETFALWFGPALFILLLDSVAMVAMGIALTCRAHKDRDKAHELLLSTNRAHKSALNQMLPLLAYPIIFFVFFAVIFAHRLYNAQPHRPNYYLLKASAAMSPGMGIVAGWALVLHIAVAKCKVKRQKQNGGSVDANDDFVTYKPEPTTIISTTHYSQLKKSEVDHGLPTTNGCI